MKNNSVYLVAIVLGISAFLISCGKGKDPKPVSPQEQTKQMLTGISSSSSTPVSWILQKETAEGVDKTALYSGFTIKFTSTGYTTTHGEPIWPASGTWSFQGTSTTTIVRDDGTEVEIEVGASSLVMTIHWTHTTLGSGREQSIAGKNIFTMVK